MFPAIQAMARLSQEEQEKTAAIESSRHFFAPFQDSHSAEPSSEQGRLLGDFRIIREIGRGGMGVVYEAEQVSLGRRVALKVLPLAAVLDQRQLQRFRNEAQAAATLHHPHIVPIISVGVERGVHYYAMHLVEGPSLEELLRGIAQNQAGRSHGKSTSALSTNCDTNAGQKSPTWSAPPDHPADANPIEGTLGKLRGTVHGASKVQIGLLSASGQLGTSGS